MKFSRINPLRRRHYVSAFGTAVGFLEMNGAAPARGLPALVTATLVGVVTTLGCVSPRVPSPKLAAESYADAVTRRDAQVLHGMLTKRAQENLSVEELAKLLEDNRLELDDFARQLQVEDPKIAGKAELFLSNQGVVELSLVDEQFFVQSDGVLPPRAGSPERVVMLFRDAVRARDYLSLRALMSERGKREMDEVFAELDDSLEHLDEAIFDVRGDEAMIQLRTGRKLLLKRQRGAWYIEEIQ